jgi:hypothetical protein
MKRNESRPFWRRDLIHQILPTINNGLTLDFSFDKSKGDNRKELVVVGKEKPQDTA